jgi:16S rRNA (guanine966-N2)-methyltransferase
LGEQALRIIAGQHRGRTLTFTQVEGLRPTPDRVRETLFNWLQPVITGARCLDMFAGSGLLGIEALSRGAGEVVFIEQQKQSFARLQENIKQLELQNASILCGDAFSLIRSLEPAFDIVFLDPPFQRNLLPQAIEQLANSDLLKPSTRVYLESEAEITDKMLPDDWDMIRSKKAGQVFYHLALKT